MSVLIIEDDPRRIKSFRRELIGVSVTNITTAPSAIAWLMDHTPKLIFLDYDLHEHGTDYKKSGCGGDVAAWMTKQTRRFNMTFVVIHSLNDDGARRMMQKLQKQGIPVARMPFVWDRPESMAKLKRAIA